MNTVLSAPLAWPPEKPRTPRLERRKGPFTTDAHRKAKTGLLPSEALARLEEEIVAWGAVEMTVTADFAVTPAGTASMSRTEGLGRYARAELDPGVTVAFRRRAREYRLACDAHTDIAQNLAAIAADLGAKRAIDRYHVTSLVEVMSYAELPRGKPAPKGWREILGDPGDLKAAMDAYRALSRVAHPDAGGSHERMVELNAAMEQARKELGGAS